MKILFLLSFCLILSLPVLAQKTLYTAGTDSSIEVWSVIREKKIQNQTGIQFSEKEMADLANGLSVVQKYKKGLGVITNIKPPMYADENRIREFIVQENRVVKINDSTLHRPDFSSSIYITIYIIPFALLITSAIIYQREKKKKFLSFIIYIELFTIISILIGQVSGWMAQLSVIGFFIMIFVIIADSIKELIPILIFILMSGSALIISMIGSQTYFVWEYYLSCLGAGIGVVLVNYLAARISRPKPVPEEAAIS